MSERDHAGGRPVAAGIAYYLVAFLFGFVLGVLRTLILEPRLGETIAVVIELPVMLGLSWLICVRFVRVFSVPPGTGPRGIMGGLALALLIGTELLVVLPLRGMTLGDYGEHLATTAGAVGLAGQLLFGLIPVIHGLIRK